MLRATAGIRDNASNISLSKVAISSTPVARIPSRIMMTGRAQASEVGGGRARGSVGGWDVTEAKMMETRMLERRLRDVCDPLTEENESIDTSSSSSDGDTNIKATILSSQMSPSNIKKTKKKKSGALKRESSRDSEAQ